MKKQSGFTLIELVIVIIVLGILAATAVPKFINLQDDAKKSAMSGVEAAVNSAANIVYSKSAINGTETQTGKTVVEGSNTINIEFGYPEASENGIEAAVEISGFETVTTGVNADNIIFVSEKDKAVDDLCLLYTEGTSSSSYTLIQGTLATATSCTE